MKKVGSFILPIILVLAFSFLTPRIFSGGISPQTLIMVGAAIILFLFMLRPKKAATKTAEAVASEILNDFCQDAFSDDEVLGKKFYAALNDLGGNMPKSAVSKLEKLAPQCTGSKEKYAVAMATALAYRTQQNYKNALREYNKAVVLHPTGNLAYTIGDCYQRLGNLDKARDSYEFATELEPGKAQYFSSLGTVCVAEGDYDSAIDYASDALALDETFSQALATMAICYGLKGDSLMHRHYMNQAVENGYSQTKIEETIKALKKR